MLDASDKSLHDEALLILLKSSNDANFERAIAEVDKNQNVSVLREHLAEILDVTTPVHAPKLALRLMKFDETALLGWLSQCKTSETAQAIAKTALEQTKTADLRTAAMAV